MHDLLQREGRDVNPKRIYWLFKELALQLRNKVPKRWLKAKLRDDRSEATWTNQVWAMAFVHDQLVTGSKFRIVTIIDTFSSYVPALDMRFSYHADDVVRTLEQIYQKTRFPKTIRVDQGAEFASRHLDLRACANGITLDFPGPRRQTDDAYIEAFNGRLRAECPNAIGS